MLILRFCMLRRSQIRAINMPIERPSTLHKRSIGLNVRDGTSIWINSAPNAITVDKTSIFFH